MHGVFETPLDVCTINTGGDFGDGRPLGHRLGTYFPVTLGGQSHPHRPFPTSSTCLHSAKESISMEAMRAELAGKELQVTSVCFGKPPPPPKRVVWLKMDWRLQLYHLILQTLTMSIIYKCVWGVKDNSFTKNGNKCNCYKNRCPVPCSVSWTKQPVQMVLREKCCQVPGGTSDLLLSHHLLTIRATGKGPWASWCPGPFSCRVSPAPSAGKAWHHGSGQRESISRAWIHFNREGKEGCIRSCGMIKNRHG